MALSAAGGGRRRRQGWAGGVDEPVVELGQDRLTGTAGAGQPGGELGQIGVQDPAGARASRSPAVVMGLPGLGLG
jgi:hypothetical protein